MEDMNTNSITITSTSTTTSSRYEEFGGSRRMVKMREEALREWREGVATGRGSVAGSPRCGVVSPRHLSIAALPTAHAVGYHMPPLPGLRGWQKMGENKAGNGLF